MRVQAADQAERDISGHEKIVDTMTVLAKGPYSGLRANHAKGIVLTGNFTPSAQASTLSRAPHFLTGTPVTVRFSNTRHRAFGRSCLAVAPDRLRGQPRSPPVGSVGREVSGQSGKLASTPVSPETGALYYHRACFHHGRNRQ